jgi:hypothetical protein
VESWAAVPVIEESLVWEVGIRFKSASIIKEQACPVNRTIVLKILKRESPDKRGPGWIRWAAA